MRSAEAFAPASVGNVAVGFDMLGHALSGVGDRVVATRTRQPGVSIDAVHGVVTDLPADPKANTAGMAALALLEEGGCDFGVILEIHKGIALGSGMGGSAASAVAAVTAVNDLLDNPKDEVILYQCALAGEKVATGSAHGDNVAPSLLGGLVFLPPGDLPPQRIPVPAGIRAVVVHPNYRVDTRKARAILAEQCELNTAQAYARSAMGFAFACINGEIDLLRASLRDVLIEPQRAELIPGFQEAQSAALAAGALGCSISGGGPSLFAWCMGAQSADHVAAALVQALSNSHSECTAYISPLNSPGAHLVGDAS